MCFAFSVEPGRFWGRLYPENEDSGVAVALLCEPRFAKGSSESLKGALVWIVALVIPDTIRVLWGTASLSTVFDRALARC